LPLLDEEPDRLRLVLLPPEERPLPEEDCEERPLDEPSEERPLSEEEDRPLSEEDDRPLSEELEPPRLRPPSSCPWSPLFS
jgi:hypothetical protein